jgi:hypothetical protein
VSLDVTRTRPLNTAEQAVARLLVYVLPVAGELLDTSKASVAFGTDSPGSPRLAVHVTIATAPSGTVGRSLGFRQFCTRITGTCRCLPRGSTSWAEALSGRKRKMLPSVREDGRIAEIREVHCYDETMSIPVFPQQLFRGSNHLSGPRAALG